MFQKAKDFLKTHETRLVLVLGFVLVAVISFEAGILKGEKWQQSPMVIEKPAEAAKIAPESPINTAKDVSVTSPKTDVASQNLTNDKNCVFVGSKNSNKYHLPTCRWAKQIKPENLVCFSSAEDATAKNYQPDKNCIK